MFRRVLAFVVLCAAALSAAPHRHRLHSNPRAAINGITEGPDGFLWLATAEGLQRFDGFHYQRISGFPFPSAVAILTTRDGAVWIGGNAGLVRYFQGRFDIIHRESTDYLAEGGTAVFASTFSGVWRIGPDGTAKQVKPRMPHRRVLGDSNGLVWSVCGERPPRPCVLNVDRPQDTAGVKALPEQVGLVVPDGERRLWVAAADWVRGYRQGRVVREIKRPPMRLGEWRPLISGRAGQVWYVGSHVEGLSPSIQFAELPGNGQHPVTAGYEDSRGHLWVARKGLGLIEFVADPDFERWYRADLDGDEPFQILRSHEGKLLAVTRSRIFQLDEKARTWSVHVPERHRYEFAYPMEDGSFLASIRTAGVVHISPDGRVLERLPDPARAPGDYREILRDPKGRLWVGSKQGLYRIDGAPGSYRLVAQQLPGLDKRPAQAVDLEIDPEGRLWAGYEAGLARLEGDTWKGLDTNADISRVRSFTFDHDYIWIAHRHADWFTRLTVRGGELESRQMDSKRGWGPRDTHFIKRQSWGWVWRGTSDGVHVSDRYQNTYSQNWIHIGAHNGLALDAADMYGYFEDRDGSVWIAGGGGVSHLRPDRRWFDQPPGAVPPRITAAAADGAAVELREGEPLSFPEIRRSLEFELGSLTASPFRSQPLMYRLSPGDSLFQPMTGGEVAFQRLSAGDYRLEVTYAHRENEKPSAVAVYAFRIGAGAAPWLSRMWWLLAAPAGVGLWAAIRRKPWMDRFAYWPSKSAFFLRRRLRPDAASKTRDYSGELLSGRYRIVEPISRGGFSMVYSARDLKNDSAIVAVKVIRADGVTDRGLRNRFIQEIAALQSIHHPGVVPILDWWVTADGEPCLAMPLLDGPTLREALERGPVSPSDAARIIRALGSALSSIHGRGIIHRDLKPENVILAGQHPVIIDFGAAGLIVPKQGGAVTTLLAGSFHYLAPERLVGKYSAASDVYSLGVIVLELLTGKRLGDLRAMHSDAGFPEELEEAVGSKPLAALLAPAFDSEPSRRPPQAETWAERIAAMLG